MDKQVEKSRTPANAISQERRLMEKALARLADVKTRTAPQTRHTGRLGFLLDLTASRSESLAKARKATARMFEAVKAIGSIEVKLVYYRGDNECRASGWENDPAVVSRIMQRLSCETGFTQIARGLKNIVKAEAEPISAIVFIGDHCEDRPDELARLGTALGQQGTPIFVFHECADHDAPSIGAKPIFKSLAANSGGAYCEFNPDAPAVLRELLSAIAAFSTAGARGLSQIEPAATPEAKQLQSRLLLLAADQKPSTTK